MCKYIILYNIINIKKILATPMYSYLNIYCFESITVLRFKSDVNNTIIIIEFKNITNLLIADLIIIIFNLMFNSMSQLCAY